MFYLTALKCEAQTTTHDPDVSVSFFAISKVWPNLSNSAASTRTSKDVQLSAKVIATKYYK